MEHILGHKTGADVLIRVVPYESSETLVVQRELSQSLGRELEQSRNTALTIVASTDDDAIVGGLAAKTSYGWLHIDALFVADRFRGRGIGAALLCAAEQRAIEADCHAVWLDTSNPHARQFYMRGGFEQFACLSNEDRWNPPAHRRWFLRKLLGVEHRGQGPADR